MTSESEMMFVARLFCTTIIFILVHSHSVFSTFRNTDVAKYNEYIPVPKLIELHGYSVEVHHVTTEDGYILELHRIHDGKSNKTSVENKPVALMVHCLFCTSSIWVVQGPDKALGYLLVEEGYDVWLLNVRGNTNSKRHVKHSTKSREFWNFSWHEMAIYDLPAAIDFILKITEEKQLTYIGYSMGTTLFFVLASFKTEYNAKIKKMVALAPACYLKNSRGMALDISVHVNLIEKFAYDTHMYEVPPPYLHAKEHLRSICEQNNIFLRAACSAVFRVVANSSNIHIQMEMLNFYLFYYPDSTSIRTVLHFYQNKNSGIFQAYDYGETHNMKKYGSWTPPKYNLSQITVPMYLFYAQDDPITDPKDITKLKKKLQNVQAIYRINVPYFSHADFGWATHVKEIVYDYVLQALRAPLRT